MSTTAQAIETPALLQPLPQEPERCDVCNHVLDFEPPEPARWDTPASPGGIWCSGCQEWKD